MRFVPWIFNRTYVRQLINASKQITRGRVLDGKAVKIQFATVAAAN